MYKCIICIYLYILILDIFIYICIYIYIYAVYIWRFHETLLFKKPIENSIKKLEQKNESLSILYSFKYFSFLNSRLPICNFSNFKISKC